MTRLDQLPSEHPLRNQPLAGIKAEYQWDQGGAWKPVLPTYRIAACTFNELGPAWTTSLIWRCL